MPLRRFCDKCNREILVGDIWFDLKLSANRDEPPVEKNIVNIFAKYCDSCIRTGDALADLYSSYNEWSNTERLKKEQKVT